MPYAVELFLDGRSSATLRGLWERIAPISSYLLDSGGIPHLTLAVCDSFDPFAAREALEGFAREVSPFRIVYSSVGVFMAEDTVVFLAPVVTSEMLDVQHRMLDLLERYTASVWAHYHLGRWVPHSTLAMKLLPAQAGTVLEACRGSALGLPLFARAEALALVEFHPVRTVYEFALGSRDSGRAG